MQGSLYIQVEPDLNVGPPAARKSIPLDAIRCQTVQSKSLGQISTWESKLRVAKESGYNMIHFTPIQVNNIYIVMHFQIIINYMYDCRNWVHHDLATL